MSVLADIKRLVLGAVGHTSSSVVKYAATYKSLYSQWDLFCTYQTGIPEIHKQFKLIPVEVDLS